MSNFGFLKGEWPQLYEAAIKAEALAFPDPRAACFYARHTLELAVHWLYKADASVKLPYDDSLDALLHEPTFKNAVGPAILAKANAVRKLGNIAVHSHKPIMQLDALNGVRELFHICFWLARTYAKGPKPADALTFNQALLPKELPVAPQTVKQLQALSEQLSQKDAQLAELLSGNLALDEELQKLRAGIASAKAANTVTPDTHDYSEAQTRKLFIDLLLREAGWQLTDKHKEVPVQGMPNNSGDGRCDYVLWADDGKPLAVVEAKRTTLDAHKGQQQAKLYADCLENQYGQRPLIFYTNGYQHWMWDDLCYPPREVQGFYTKEELELAIQRRTSRHSLASAEIDPAIVERYYQIRAIRRIAETFEKEKQRKVLLVMATGAGKTRTVIALCDILMRCNWAKRILFLADRTALVNQAVRAFKEHLPGSSPVNLVTEKDTNGRVYVSTYPTMMNLINGEIDNGGKRRFGPGYFDLVVIDEAHRSVYQKYRAIFEYFDSLLVGLTATPKNEIDRNTYSLFELETGVPTDAYDLEDAVKDGFLVPPKAVSVPLKFPATGVTYDELSEEEKEEWDAKEWSENGSVPDRVEAEAVNKWLFNSDTVDKVLEFLMTKGQTVADGDRSGKTIIFAKSHAHALFIQERFNKGWAKYAGHFARVIDFQTDYAQSLIDDFSNPEKMPQIAISVDMLDTGIDVPEVVNLVFFKTVRSKTKFWQMVGRGTRLRKDLFGPGGDKRFFYIFDFCNNLAFFKQNPEVAEGSSGDSMTKRLFTARLDLISELDRLLAANKNATGIPDLRQETAELLRLEVEGMNTDDFLVRPKRQYVECYSQPEAWTAFSQEAQHELAEQVAGLPSENVEEEQEAKQFDLLMLRLQLAVLRAETAFSGYKERLIEIASALQEKSAIPMVAEQMELILEIQTDAYWQNVTVAMLEQARKRLRQLAKFIEKAKRKPVYTNFQDQMGEAVEHEIVQTNGASGVNMERFREKARQYLLAHQDHPTIHKLRWNVPINAADLEALEQLLLKAGAGHKEEIALAKESPLGFGLFLRSLVGLDRDAAKLAFSGFLNGKPLKATQVEFINAVIDYLTQQGWMDGGHLYESPFTDKHPLGVEGVFDSGQVMQLLSVLDQVRLSAAA